LILFLAAATTQEKGKDQQTAYSHGSKLIEAGDYLNTKFDFFVQYNTTISMNALQRLLAEYSESHLHPTNILIHWICVPLIFWSITGFLFLVTLPFIGNLAIPALIILTVYYAVLSRTLWVGMLLFSLLCLVMSYFIFIIYYQDAALIFGIVFVLAWTGQFAGHKIEGKKPSFLKDLQFLLIGPAWLMAKIYRKAGITI